MFWNRRLDYKTVLISGDSSVATFSVRQKANQAAIGELPSSKEDD